MSATGQKRLRYVFSVTSGATPESSNSEYWDGDIFWATPEDVSSADGYWLRDTRRKITQAGYQSCGTTIVRSGSVLLTKRAPIGQLSILAVAACSNQGCFLLTPRDESDTRFFYYWLSTQTAYLQVLGRGSTFMELSTDELKSLNIPHPSVLEQRAVADYLDRETSQIDALVAAKERLLALLAEKRRALITRAVTRGLDPHAPMTASGVDWLGEMPMHWEIKPLKYAVTFQRGHDLPQEERLEGPIPIISSAGQFGWHNRAVAQTPGIVTGRYGTIGEFYLVEQDYWPLNTTLYSIDLHDNQPRFLWYMLQAMTDLFLLHAGKSAVPGVDRNDLHPIPVAVPPIAEQRQITAYLDAELAKLDALAAANARSIALLKERRTALIAAAVTGRVDIGRQ